MAGDVVDARLHLGFGEAIPLVVAGGPDAAAVEGLADARFEAGDGFGRFVVAVVEQGVQVPGLDRRGEQAVAELGAGGAERFESGALLGVGQVDGPVGHQHACVIDQGGVAGEDDAVFDVTTQVARQPGAERGGGEHGGQ